MGEYVVPDWKQSVEQNMFKTTVGEQTFHIVKVEYLTGAQAERMSKIDEIEGGMYTVLDEICPGLGAAYRDVPNKFFLEFLEKWHKDSSVEPGESEASSGS